MGIKLPYRINKDDEPSMGFEIPPGKYLVKVLTFDKQTPKPKPDGKIGDDYIAANLEIMDAASEKGENCIGFKIFEKLSFSEAARFRITGFVKAIFPSFDGDDIPDDKIIDQLLTVDTKLEEFEGRVNTRCQTFKSAKGWNGRTVKVDGAGNVTYKEESGKGTEKSAKPAKADGKEEVSM